MPSFDFQVSLRCPGRLGFSSPARPMPPLPRIPPAPGIATDDTVSTSTPHVPTAEPAAMPLATPSIEFTCSSPSCAPACLPPCAACANRLATPPDVSARYSTPTAPTPPPTQPQEPPMTATLPPPPANPLAPAAGPYPQPATPPILRLHDGPSDADLYETIAPLESPTANPAKADTADDLDLLKIQSPDAPPELIEIKWSFPARFVESRYRAGPDWFPYFWEA